jgi:DNA-binding transcriptional regulator YdaS (Cro superfamily)
MTLGEWLRRTGWTQERVAATLDDTCTQALVSKWVRGVTLPSPARRAAIESLTVGRVTARGLVLRYKRMKAKIKARGAIFRAMRDIE